ncbi:MAG: helix-turn-helix domain-containing protein [Desulfococcaceae bacterium]
MKSKPRRDGRRAFFESLEAGEMADLPETVRRMRKSIGLTQTQYAKLAGVAPRVLMDLERGAGNPTLKTLEKLAAPFGLQVGLVSKGRRD